MLLGEHCISITNTATVIVCAEKEESPFPGQENFHTISLNHFRAMTDLFNNILSRYILTEIAYIFIFLNARYLRFNTVVTRGNHIRLSII